MYQEFAISYRNRKQKKKDTTPHRKNGGLGFAIKLNKPKTPYIILLASAIIITILGIASIAMKIFINWSPIIIGMLIGGGFLARMLMAKKIFNIRYRNCKDWFKKVQTK